MPEAPMRVGTLDRGEIIHFAGAHGLSPALRGEAPALVSGHDPSAVRCGWAAFFSAVDDRRLALVLDPEDPSSAELRPASEARALRPGHGGLAGALDHSRRFLRALR